MRAAVIAVLAAAVLVGCGEKTVRADKAEETITRFVDRRTGFRPTDMDCPSGVEAKVGGTFKCHFTGPEGPYTAFVRIAKVEGERVEFQIISRRSG